MPTFQLSSTQIEIDIDFINEPLIFLENNVRSAIHNLNLSFQNFWTLPDDQLNTLLNFEGVSTLQIIFSAYRAYGSCLTNILVDRGINEPIPLLSATRIVVIDLSGFLSVIPLSIVTLSSFELSSIPLSTIVNFDS